MVDAPKLRTAIALWADDLGLGLSNLDGDMLIDRIRSALVATPPAEQHPDDIAVDRFAASMKEKLKWEREQRNRSGWQAMSAADLSRILYEHLPKGDPVDVANLSMMLHQNGQQIETPPAEPVVETDWINYRPLAEGEIIQESDECLTDRHLGWQPAGWTVGGAAASPYTAHRMYRRPLATKPAVKDDETVVEADFDNWWRASKYRQVIYADESQRQIALDAWRAALATKLAVKDDETVVEALRKEADSAYCRFLDKMSAPLCLGVEHKLETGKFGAAELNAHVDARELYGFHRGINHALAALAATEGQNG